MNRSFLLIQSKHLIVVLNVEAPTNLRKTKMDTLKKLPKNFV